MPATFADSWLVAVPYVVTLAICMAFLAKVPAIARLGPLQGFLLMLVIFGVGTFAVRSGLETVGAQMRASRDECAGAPAGSRWEYDSATETEYLMAPVANGWQEWCSRYTDRGDWTLDDDN